jgi:uncharacterized protein YgbK (DUF1537 family)
MLSLRGLLTREEITKTNMSNTPGLVIVGSFVGKTTIQLEKLRELEKIELIEFNVFKVLNKADLKDEINRIVASVYTAFEAGRDVCIYTSRRLLKHDMSVETTLKYVIFPGNVGDDDTLKKVIEVFRNEEDDNS